MSSLTTLARPYAKAAFSLAQDSGEKSAALAAWQGMLGTASELAANEQLAQVLENPLVPPVKAVELLNAAAGAAFSDRFRAFLEVLGANRRLNLLPEILALFSKLKQAAEQRLQVRVVAARELDEDQAKRISEALARRFDCAIELDCEIDPGILGGAVIYAGDEVIDGSLRGRLNKLSSALAR